MATTDIERGIAQGSPRERRSHDGLLLAMACIAQVMVVLDVSVVTVALPSISKQLHYSTTGLQWVVNAYVLTFAGFLLLGGRGADLFGRRRAFLFGLGLFTIASVSCAVAQNAQWLTAARAAQGVGAAVLSPATLTIIVTSFSGRALGKGLGLWGAMGGVGGALGVILGGILTNQLGWPWVFFINVPLAAVAAICAAMYLTEHRREDAAKLDVIGAITVTASLAGLVYAIVTTDQYSWGSTHTLGIGGGSLALMMVFLWTQTKRRHPLVPLGVFKIRTVAVANWLMFVIGLVAFAMWFFLSLYLQDVVGYSSLVTGFAFVPMSVMIALGAQVMSRLIARFGARPAIVTGMVSITIGFLWLSRVNGHGGFTHDVLGGGLFSAFGFGGLFTALATAGTEGVPQSQAGLVSGLLNASRQVGGSVGLAVLATVATSHTPLNVHTPLQERLALAHGYGAVFFVSACIGIAGILTALAMPSGVRRHAPVATQVG